MAKAAVSPSAETKGFRGFGPDALSFFKALAFHQSREWFQENRPIYDTQVYAPLAALVEAVTEELRARGIPLSGEGKRSIFRIHRDVRFSKDKSPYKTHAGATLTRDGQKLTQGLLYIHIAPEGSFTALGFYQPSPAELQALRTAIASAPAKWKTLEAHLAKQDLTLSREDALARLPKGFDPAAVADLAEVLKLKSFTVSRDIPQERIYAPELVDLIASFAEAGLPLLDFGWAAIDRAKAVS